MVPPYAIHLRYNNQSPETHRFPPFSLQEMAVSPHSCVLQTKVGYQKKRKTMVFPPVCHTAVKLHHGDHQDKRGIFPTATGIFPNKKKGDNWSGDCSTGYHHIVLCYVMLDLLVLVMMLLLSFSHTCQVVVPFVKGISQPLVLWLEATRKVTLATATRESHFSSTTGT